jgi:hypothetical protein
VILVPGAVAGRVRVVGIAIFVAVAMPRRIHEGRRHEDIDRGRGPDVMECGSRTQERQGTRHHRDGDEEAEASQDCCARHGKDLEMIG